MKMELTQTKFNPNNDDVCVMCGNDEASFVAQANYKIGLRWEALCRRCAESNEEAKRKR